MRTLVADRDDTIRAGIRSLLSRRERPSDIEEVRNRSELLQHTESRDFDLIIVEPLLGEGPSDALIKTLRDLAPQTNLLVFTALDEAAHGVHAISSGARGYLMKTCSLEEFFEAVDRVGNGRVSISSTLAELCARSRNPYGARGPLASLSEREIDVYALLVAGKKVSEIGTLLDLSVKTVSTHKARVFEKLPCRNLSELVKHAITNDLIPRCRERADALTPG
jgi:DNA-binding NarL/FixJ family response regulator